MWANYRRRSAGKSLIRHMACTCYCTFLLNADKIIYCIYLLVVNKSFWEFFSNTPGLICHNCDLGCLSFIDFCDNAQLSSMVLTNRWTPAVCIHPPALLRLSPLFIFYSISGDLANSLDKGSWSRMSWGIFCAKQKDFTCVEEQWADQMCSELWRKKQQQKFPGGHIMI